MSSSQSIKNFTLNCEQSVSKTVTSVTGGSDSQRSTSQPQQQHLISQWLQETTHQPSTIEDLRIDQLGGLAQISQQLLTSNISNQDYQAIMLTYQADVEENQAKIVDEAGQDANCDVWLDMDFTIEMDALLAKFREYTSQQVSTLQTSNDQLTAQVHALTTLVQSQQADIPSLVDSYKHLQMQKSVALGAIMGAEKSLTQEVDIGMERLIKAAEGPSLSREFDELLKALRASLNDNFFTYKKALERTINSLRVILATKDNFQERRIMVNINDSGVDRLCHGQQEAYHALESELKTKRKKTFEDEEMIKLLGRYLRNVEANFPKTQINKDNLDDDEQKKDDQKPSGSNPSQSTRVAGSKGGERKEDEKKDVENEDYFQKLAEEIVRVWIVSLKKVRIYYTEGSFTFLGCALMDSLSPTEIKRVISLLKDKDTATRAWRSVLAEWLIAREERRARSKAEYEEKKMRYDKETEMYIKRSEKLKVKGMSSISKDGRFLNVKAGSFSRFKIEM
ncbi:hypothetical protein AgCh_038456 [Apium graveolens]